MEMSTKYWLDPACSPAARQPLPVSSPPSLDARSSDFLFELRRHLRHRDLDNLFSLAPDLTAPTRARNGTVTRIFLTSPRPKWFRDVAEVKRWH
jgi:hypothetical protein